MCSVYSFKSFIPKYGSPTHKFQKFFELLSTKLKYDHAGYINFQSKKIIIKIDLLSQKFRI